MKGRGSDRFRDAGSDSGRDGGRDSGRGRFAGRREDPRGGRKPFSRDRDQAKPIAVEVPVGEAERFNAYPADDLIWGRHAAQAALESGRPVHRIWCTPEMRFQPRFLQLLREAKSGGVLVEEVTWSRLGQLTNGAVHQGIVMQAAAADTLDLGSLIDGCRDLGEPPLLMALDGITDPHNLGAIVRSAEALGAHGLVLPQRRSAGLTGSVAKVAAGALEHLPVARVVNLNRALDSLKNEGYRVIGLAGEGSVALSEADLDGPLVVVTGSEGDGLSMLTRKHCDQLVRIPIRGATPSLNASVATAMVLYEVARRSWMQKISGAAPAPRIVRPQMPTPPPLELPEEDSTAVAEVAISPAEEVRAEQLVNDVMAEFQADAQPMPDQGDGAVELSDDSADGADPSATFSSDIKL
ncbi:23S rRNA (guanosine(2251)-2'-O)-methyltransferase RlmB [Synechococcus sp. A10-1-5-1]|uniref:23S rRNA (guanosine(2251)-2'-O)-methyltransferase RlmB n=1 Tax=Synechococcus sp. A10-1-5-1 TaxID=2936507 RepID=UPI00353012BC